MTSLRARAVARCRDDSGQLTLLITGLTVVVLTLIIGALAVTSVQISRMRLLDAADSAALEVQDAFTLPIAELREAWEATLPKHFG